MIFLCIQLCFFVQPVAFRYGSTGGFRIRRLRAFSGSQGTGHAAKSQQQPKQRPPLHARRRGRETNAKDIDITFLTPLAESPEP